MPTIIAFDDLKNALDLEKTAYSDYPQLEAIADSVHDALENFAGKVLRGIEKKTETGFLEADAEFIDLANLPITSVTSVTIDGVATTDYKITGNGIKLIYGYAEYDVWTVVTKGGYKTIPPDIHRAELMQIIYEYQNINNLATKSFTNDGGSTQTNEGFALLKEVQRLLRPYRHVKKLGF